MKFILYIDYFIFYNSATTQQQHNATLRFKLSDKRASNSFYKVNVKMSSPAGELTKEQRKVFDDSVRDDDATGREQTFAEPEVEDLLDAACPTCEGRGQIKTARSVCYDIMREILREARQFSPTEFRIVAAANVVEMLLDEESQHLAGLSDFIGKPISLQVESLFSQEQYDIILM